MITLSRCCYTIFSNLTFPLLTSNRRLPAELQKKILQLLSSPVEQFQVLSSTVLQETFPFPGQELNCNQENSSLLNTHAAALLLSQVGCNVYSVQQNFCFVELFSIWMCYSLLEIHSTEQLKTVINHRLFVRDIPVQIAKGNCIFWWTETLIVVSANCDVVFVFLVMHSWPNSWKMQTPNRLHPGLIYLRSVLSSFALLKADNRRHRATRSHTSCPSSTVSSHAAQSASQKVATRVKSLNTEENLSVIRLSWNPFESAFVYHVI